VRAYFLDADLNLSCLATRRLQSVDVPAKLYAKRLASYTVSAVFPPVRVRITNSIPVASSLHTSRCSLATCADLDASHCGRVQKENGGAESLILSSAGHERRSDQEGNRCSADTHTPHASNSAGSRGHLQSMRSLEDRHSNCLWGRLTPRYSHVRRRAAWRS
jgi:hypothetical protein